MGSGHDNNGPILRGFLSPISGMFLYGGATIPIEAARPARLLVALSLIGRAIELS